MRLNAPKKIVWIISLVAGLLGILFTLWTVPFVSDFSFLFLGVCLGAVDLKHISKGHVT